MTANVWLIKTSSARIRVTQGEALLFRSQLDKIAVSSGKSVEFADLDGVEHRLMVEAVTWIGSEVTERG
jgi:hypothetical protein